MVTWPFRFTYPGTVVGAALMKPPLLRRVLAAASAFCSLDGSFCALGAGSAPAAQTRARRWDLAAPVCLPRHASRWIDEGGQLSPARTQHLKVLIANAEQFVGFFENSTLLR